MLQQETSESKPLLRRPSQEVQIDHLLAEEFACDPEFVSRFVQACSLPSRDIRVTATIAEPSLGGDGFGDLFVDGTDSEGRRIALLIEDKITAAPALRQAERYAAYALHLRESGYQDVWTVLVAPAAYLGERDRYDAHVSLETVSTIVASRDPARLAYRRAVIERALAKKTRTGVQIPDTALHGLKTAYLQFASEWCAREHFSLDFPSLRESYYDGDAWIEKIGCAIFPPGIYLRHRLWTDIRAASGSVDLIFVKTTAAERDDVARCPLEGSLIQTFSNGKGTQISFPVAEMRQRSGFDEVIATQALETMRRLVVWFKSASVRSQK